MRKLKWLLPLLLVTLWSGNLTYAQSRLGGIVSCEDTYSLCTERQYNRSYEYPGKYIGHDEPSLLFYSDEPGSGDYNVYKLVLPTDPPKFPTDANPKGTGRPTVWNFQLHPAFWFGMALCDSESNPLFTHRCEPDSDENIFDDANPKSKRYIGRHPGAAFLELQFYPPGWATSYTTNQYAVALHINSYSVQALGPTGPIANNTDCQNKVGLETTTFALLTLDGKSQAPGDPLNSDPNKQAVIAGETFLMNPGDTLIVTIRDTEDGLLTTVKDLTTGLTGFMTASIANGFAQIVFDPNATTCTSRPYAFHPMYATSSEHTRVPWAAHTYNVAFSDEIGHFNYCDAQDGSFIPGLLGACLSSPIEKRSMQRARNEVDDFLCVDPASSLIFGSLGPLGGCLDSDVDFDGVPYHNAWAGTGPDPYGFSAVPSPILFTSPKFMPNEGEGEERDGNLQSFKRVAFEADLPAIEDSTVCDVLTGNGCVNPPPGALFYPIYSTTEIAEGCWWQLGGPAIPGTKDNFGGSSATEYKMLLGSVYIDGTLGRPGSIVFFENYHRVLPYNPCK
jgi:hypothetical protein